MTATAFVLFVAGCSLLGDFDVTQCATDSDCAGTSDRKTCSADHFCVKSASTATEGGATDAGIDTGVVVPPMPECKVTKDCPTDRERICIEGTLADGGPSGAKECVPLVDSTNSRCTMLVQGGANDAYQDDGAFFVGVYMADVANTPARAAVVNAVTRLNADLKAPPRIAAVLCDKGGSSDKKFIDSVIPFLRARSIPVLVGQLEPDEIAKGDGSVALWSTLSNSASLQPGPGGLVGSTNRFLVDEMKNLIGGFQAAADQAVNHTVPYRGAPGANFRVALVTNKLAESKALGDAIQASVTFNGSLINVDTPPAGSGRFELPASWADADVTQRAQLATNLATNRPHVIVAVGGDEMALLMDSVESQIPSTGNGSGRSVWIFASHTKFNFTQLNNYRSREVFWDRFFGVDFSGDATKLAAFYAASNNYRNIRSYDNVYDGVYAATFAWMRARYNKPQGNLTPADMSRGLDEVFPATGAGEVVNGPDAFETKFSAVRSGTTVSYTGVTGPFVFETEHGTRRMGTSYFCFPNSSGDLLFYLDETGMKTKCAQ